MRLLSVNHASQVLTKHPCSQREKGRLYDAWYSIHDCLANVSFPLYDSLNEKEVIYLCKEHKFYLDWPTQIEVWENQTWPVKNNYVDVSKAYSKVSSPLNDSLMPTSWQEMIWWTKLNFLGLFPKWGNAKPLVPLPFQHADFVSQLGYPDIFEQVLCKCFNVNCY